MWIIPNKLLYLLPQDTEGWSLDLNSLELNYELPLMWRSKPSLLRTWLLRWKKVSWVKFLFGQILKPSLQETFTERYTESLPDIHANLSPMPGNGGVHQTSDTFSRLYTEQLRQLSLFGVSSKTSKDTSRWDMTKFTKAYELLVTMLRAEYSQRMKLAHHTSENGSISLQSRWSTPMLPRCRESFSEMTRHSPTLEAQVKWPTPVASETEKACKGQHQECLTQLALNGQLEEGSNNTTGSIPGRLNPAWVAQLMGTTLEQIFYVH